MVAPTTSVGITKTKLKTDLVARTTNGRPYNVRWDYKSQTQNGPRSAGDQWSPLQRPLGLQKPNPKRIS